MGPDVTKTSDTDADNSSAPPSSTSSPSTSTLSILDAENRTARESNDSNVTKTEDAANRPNTSQNGNQQEEGNISQAGNVSEGGKSEGNSAPGAGNASEEANMSQGNNAPEGGNIGNASGDGNGTPAMEFEQFFRLTDEGPFKPKAALTAETEAAHLEEVEDPLSRSIRSFQCL